MHPSVFWVSSNLCLGSTAQVMSESICSRFRWHTKRSAWTEKTSSSTFVSVPEEIPWDSESKVSFQWIVRMLNIIYSTLRLILIQNTVSCHQCRQNDISSYIDTHLDTIQFALLSLNLVLQGRQEQKLQLAWDSLALDCVSAAWSN